MSRTWILTGSPENCAATRDHGFSVIGLEERSRDRAGKPGKVDARPWRFLNATGVVNA